MIFFFFLFCCFFFLKSSSKASQKKCVVRLYENHDAVGLSYENAYAIIKKKLLIEIEINPYAFHFLRRSFGVFPSSPQQDIMATKGTKRPLSGKSSETNTKKTSGETNGEATGVNCNCKAEMMKRVSKKDGREFIACDQRKSINGIYSGGCGLFFWADDFQKLLEQHLVCKEHTIIKCPCLQDPRITEALALNIKCFCDVPARAALTKKDPSYVFYNCGSKRFKDSDGNWQSKCKYFARYDEVLPMTE